MKKTVFRILVIALVAVIGLGMAACGDGSGGSSGGGGGGGGGHSHSYGDWYFKTDANCTTGVIQERACSCGNKQTQETGMRLGHNFSATTPATCTANSIPGICTRASCGIPSGAVILASHRFVWTITTPPVLYPASEGTGTRICSVCLNTSTSIPYMVQVEGGSFLYEKAPFDIILQTVDAFSIGRYQVTQNEWTAVMTGNVNGINATPSSFSSDHAEGEIQGRRPVERVSFYDVLVFCNRVSVLLGLSPAYELPNVWPNPTSWSSDPATWGTMPTYIDDIWDNVRIADDSTGYRLPEGYQWQFAAKGGRNNWLGYTGTESDTYFVYSGSNDANLVAWYDGKTGIPTNNRTHQVGILLPNELGIYDMSGNVYEWCFELSGVARIVLGGGWNHTVSYTRSVFKYVGRPDLRLNYQGLRVVRP